LACFAVQIYLALCIRVSSVFNLWLKKNMPTDLIHRIGITAPAETAYVERGVKNPYFK